MLAGSPVLGGCFGPSSSSSLVWVLFFSNMDPVPVLVFKFGEGFWFLLFFNFQVKIGFNFWLNNLSFR